MTRLIVTLMFALATTTLSAEPLPARWAYRTVVVGDPFVSTSGVTVPGGPTLYAAPSTGAGYAAAEFTGQDPWTPFTPGEPLLASSVVVRAAAAGDFRAEFDSAGRDGFYPGGYTLFVGVKDLLTEEIAEFRFRGLFSGEITLSPSAPPQYTFANQPAGRNPAARTLGPTRIEAVWGDVTPPGAPFISVGDDSFDGAAGESWVVITTGAVAETPEPSTLLLAGLGVGVWAARFRRRAS